MPNYTFPPQVQPALSIYDSEQKYPVSRIFCIGRNYADHVKEMGGTPERETPVYFTKSANAIFNVNSKNHQIDFALGTTNLHYEMELVVALGNIANVNTHTQKPLANISVTDAEKLIFGYACGLDMTRRDLQNLAKKTSAPWDLAKSFADSAVISPLRLSSDCGSINRGFIRLSQNGKIQQNSNLEKMIWKIPEIISNLSQYYYLQAGDIIFTGTPEGVGPVEPGDELFGEIENVGELKINIKLKSANLKSSF